MEVNTDRLFCDYTQAQVRFGPANYSTTTREYTPLGPSFSLPESISNWQGWFIAQNLTITNLYSSGPPTYFSGDPRPYVVPGNNGGYCSMVDSSAVHRRNNLSASGYRAYETFINKFFKILNPSIITKWSDIKDRGAVSSYRDGEGYFLDFGSTHLSNHLKTTNTLSFPWTTPGGQSAEDSVRNLNVYFSTLMGVTMTCGGDITNTEAHTCLEYDPKVVEENTYVLRLSYINSDSSPGSGDVIDNFFTGGSQIKNPGTISLIENPTNLRSMTPTETTSSTDDFTYVNGIVVNQANFNSNTFQLERENFVPGGTPGPGQWSVTTANTSDLGEDTTLSYYNPKWELSRDAKLRYFSGGHSKSGLVGESDLYNGRFSLNIREESNHLKAGVRCAVKLYEDEE